MKLITEFWLKIVRENPSLTFSLVVLQAVWVIGSLSALESFDGQKLLIGTLTVGLVSVVILVAIVLGSMAKERSGILSNVLKTVAVVFVSVVLCIFAWGLFHAIDRLNGGAGCEMGRLCLPEDYQVLNETCESLMDADATTKAEVLDICGGRVAEACGALPRCWALLTELSEDPRQTAEPEHDPDVLDSPETPDVGPNSPPESDSDAADVGQVPPPATVESMFDDDELLNERIRDIEQRLQQGWDGGPRPSLQQQVQEQVPQQMQQQLQERLGQAR